LVALLQTLAGYGKPSSMNQRESRYVKVAKIAVALSIVFILTTTGGWAAPIFQGTVPQAPQVPVTGDCLETVNMGTAIFSVQPPDCIKMVELVKTPAATYVPAPEGFIFVGDTFKVTANPEDSIIQVCYAYPSEFVDKDAKIYRLNEDATPNVWVDIPGAKFSNGTICVTSVAGIFSLIGTP
jgi:hypothetical protein